MKTNGTKFYKETFFFGVCLFLTTIGLIGCSVEELSETTDGLNDGIANHTCAMNWNGEHPNFEGVTTRAATTVWADGSRLYLKLLSGSDTLLATANYSVARKEWSVDYKGTLADSGKCLMYYFDKPSIVNSSSVTMDMSSIPYADEHATYAFNKEQNVISISGHLTPNCVRIRFAGSPGKRISTAGLKICSGYDVTKGSLMLEKWMKTLTVSVEEENLWYTPYVYAQLESNSKLYVISNGMFYERSLTNKQLAKGKGGWLEIPTQSYYAGWSLTDEKTPLDSLMTLKFDGSATSAQKEVINTIFKNMVIINGGTFTMGATEEQGADAGSNEKPAHQVTLYTYFMNKYELTQKEYSTLLSPLTSWSNGSGAKYPAYCLSYSYECRDLINKINSLCNLVFSLPSEAQWEYASRGGRKSQGYKYSGSNTIDEVAWFAINGGSMTHPVGLKNPNELGLYDMSGNIEEWCLDAYYATYTSSSPQSNYYVCRGGSWLENTFACRVSFRNSIIPTSKPNNLGMRLAITLN